MKNAFTFLTFLTFLLLSGLQLTGQNLDAVKRSMQERLPQVEALWKNGQVGENNRGFLEARTSLNRTQDELVKAENADRAKVYAAIAASTNVPSERVGQQRAAQIAQRAAQGLWLQRPNGEWYKK